MINVLKGVAANATRCGACDMNRRIATELLDSLPSALVNPGLPSPDPIDAAAIPPGSSP